VIETVRISPAAKDQLVTLKRRTGLKHWNELGRWALCRSLAEPTRPPDVPIPTDGGIEIEWRTFAGRIADLYLDLLCQRCVADGLDPDARTVQRQLLLHLHRGIGYLVGDPALSKVAEGDRLRRGTAVRELVGAGLGTAPVDAAASGG
jgi:DNA sulfur modification protein DndE